MVGGKILVVITSTSKYPSAAKPAGLWFSEAIHFVDVVEKAGYQVDFVSPKGGYIPIDPVSLTESTTTDVDWTYYTDAIFMARFGVALKPSQIDAKDYKAIYYTGGHGVVFDFPNDEMLQKIASSIYESGGYVSAVCHGLAGLINLRLPNGKLLIEGKKLTGFSNSEESAVGIEKLLPFYTQTELSKVGAVYSKAPKPWESYVVQDGRLITGQNPASAAAVAHALVKNL